MRLTGHARGLIARLALAKGVSQTDIVEMAVREYAEAHGVITSTRRDDSPRS